MRDINLKSSILRLVDFPVDTTKIMILFDERGWAIKCYDDSDSNNKITTMVTDSRRGDSGSDSTLVPNEQL